MMPLLENYSATVRLGSHIDRRNHLPGILLLHSLIFHSLGGPLVEF